MQDERGVLAGIFFKLLACSCCRGCGVAGQSGPVRSGKRGPAGPGTFYEMNKGRSNFVLKPENWKTDVFFEGFQEQNFPVAFFAQERKTGRLSVQHLPECKHPPSRTRRIERFPLGLFDCDGERSSRSVRIVSVTQVKPVFGAFWWLPQRRSFRCAFLLFISKAPRAFSSFPVGC